MTSFQRVWRPDSCGCVLKCCSDLWSVITVNLRAVQVVTPRPQRVDDGQQLLLVHGVARLGVEHLLGQEGDGLQALALVLLQHGADGEPRGVGVHDERKLGVGQHEHGSLRDGGLELVEGLPAARAPQSNLTLSLVSSESGAAMALKSLMNLR